MKLSFILHTRISKSDVYNLYVHIKYNALNVLERAVKLAKKPTQKVC